MALNKQNAHLDLKGGMDQSTDNRLVIPSKLLDARDVVFDDATPQTLGSGTVVRRGGLTSQGILPVIYGGESVGTPLRLSTNEGKAIIEDLTNSRMVVVSGDRDTNDTATQTPSTVYGSFSNTRMIRAGLETTPISGNIYPFYSSTGNPGGGGEYDCAAAGGRTLWVWQHQASYGSAAITLKYALMDNVTGAALLRGDIGTAGYKCVAPRVVYAAGKFFVYHAEYAGAASYTYDIKVTTFEHVGSEVMVGAASTVHTSTSVAPDFVGAAGYVPLFDVVADVNNPTQLFMVVAEETTLYFYTLETMSGYSSVNEGFTTVSSAPGNLAIVTTTGTYGYVAFWGKAICALRSIAWDETNFNTEATVNTPVPGSGSLGRITAAVSGSSIYVAFDLYAPTLGVASAIITLKLAATGFAIQQEETVSATNWFVAGRLFESAAGWVLPAKFYSQNYVAGGGYEVGLQPTYYLLDLKPQFAGAGGNSTVIARVDYAECGYNTQTAISRVASTVMPGNTSYEVEFGYPRWVVDAQLVEGNYLQPIQLRCARVNFEDKLGQAEVNGLTYLAGGCPHFFDGERFYDAGFHHAPEIFSLTAAATSGLVNGLAVGTYYFTCTVGFQDAKGNWHESAPADPVAVTTAGTNVNVLASAITPPPFGESSLIWYRTVLDGGVAGPFYRAVGVTGAGTVSDATLQTSEQLYTVPGVAGQPLPHDPMPACRHIEQHQDRLFLAGCGDGYTVYYSNQTAQGRGVEFSVLLQKRTDYEFGRVVGTQSQDGKLYVLGERQIGVLLGQGPTDTGEQDGYSDIEVIVHGTGAKWRAPKSIATTGDGVWFQSNTNGLRLLSRNGSLAQRQGGGFVGSEMDAQLGTSYVVNAALVGDNTSQVRFYHSGGGVLVYDTKWGQWSRFSNHTHVDACYADGRFYHITSTPKLLYYDETAHTDDGTAITMSLLFPWLSLAGLQGFQRVYSVLFLGGFFNDTVDTQVVTLKTAYNYDSTQTTAINAQDVTASGASLLSLQFEHKLSTQKCESLQLQLDVKSKTPGARFRLSDVLLQVGLKQGRFRLPAARRF